MPQIMRLGERRWGKDILEYVLLTAIGFHRSRVSCCGLRTVRQSVGQRWKSDGPSIPDRQVRRTAPPRRVRERRGRVIGLRAAHPTVDVVRPPAPGRSARLTMGGAQKAGARLDSSARCCSRPVSAGRHGRRHVSCLPRSALLGAGECCAAAYVDGGGSRKCRWLATDIHNVLRNLGVLRSGGCGSRAATHARARQRSPTGLMPCDVRRRTGHMRN